MNKQAKKIRRSLLLKEKRYAYYVQYGKVPSRKEMKYFFVKVMY